MSTSESADPVEQRRQGHQRESLVVDRASLEILGLILGGVTAAVIVIAAVLVHSHIAAEVAPNKVVPKRTTPAVPAALSAQR